MSHNKNHDSPQLPVGRLGIISPYSCAELGTKVDNYLIFPVSVPEKQKVS